VRAEPGEVSKQLGVTGYTELRGTSGCGATGYCYWLGAAFIIAHASTAESFDLISAARRHGSEVTCDVTPHHFVLDESAALDLGAMQK